MSAIAKFAWSFRGRDEVKSLVSNRSSFATQLDFFLANQLGGCWSYVGGHWQD